MNPWLFVVAVTLAAPAILAAKVADESASPAVGARLAGAWRLDPRRSEDAREKMRAQRERQRGGREGGGGFGGRAGGRMGGGREGMDPQAMREAMDEMLEAPEAMALTVGRSEVQITPRDGRIRRIRPDGRKVRHDAPPSESQARWDGESLVNETWLGGGMIHLVERWTFEPRTRELVSSLRIENQRLGGEPITAERVYVPEVPEAPPASPSGCTV